ncbi:membrane protein [Mycobacterium phage SoilDragon]|uniref:Membrane protein n=1 Tax=Mycobacterium phage SoilDragon TaxID=2590944 RepID=A0A516KUH6_9CAUD|nr:excisionase [Mycobacterium phage SoilDragon]QDP45336.1 membrane protein [Mycobacterium phage SoilDragon]
MRIVSRQRVALRVATAGTVAVGGLAFALSFTALSELSTANGVAQAWMVPLVVDGGIIVATAATVALTRHRWYAWTLLLFSSLVSVAGNVTHAQPHGAVAMVIAAIPPLWLLAATHLTVMLSRERSENEPVPVAAESLRIANAA